jgi:hypothetical protein
LTPRGSHIPAVAEDDAEPDDKMLLDIEILLDAENTEDIPLNGELLKDDIAELIVDVAEFRVIFEVVVIIAFAEVDVAEEAPGLDRLEEMLARELKDEDRRLVLNDEALGLVFAMLDAEIVPALGIALEVLGPDEVVRLVDIVEDKRVLVEDEEPVMGELELEGMSKLVDSDIGVLEDALELLAALEICADERLIALDTIVDGKSVKAPEVVPGPDEGIILDAAIVVDDIIGLGADVWIDEAAELEEIARDVEEA